MNVFKNLLMNYLDTIGLIFNFIGTILVVFFIDKDTNEYVTREGSKPQKKYYALLIKHPSWLYIGVVFIIIGFLSFLASLIVC